MKTIPIIIIINSQNCQSELVSSHHNINFQKKLCLRTGYTEAANTGWPKCQWITWNPSDTG